MVNYYLQTDVKQVLTDFRAYLLINIANEWSGTTSYLSAYQTAISTLRTNGINHTLVIDANGSGQTATTIFTNANSLLTSDTQHNLLFSVHMYSNYSTTTAVDNVLNQAASSSPRVPLVVGEFGPSFNGTTVAWQEITLKCQSLGLGYMPWSWKGNSSGSAQLDMAQDWPGPLTAWGQNIMVNDANSIQRTAVKASIYP
jgi:mannan endo-1,4-beta-mannosidase